MEHHEIEFCVRYTVPKDKSVTLELVDTVRDVAGAPRDAELQIYGSTVTFTWTA